MEQDLSRGGWGDGVLQAEGGFPKVVGEGGGPGLEAQVVAALEAGAGEAPGWVRLLPLGEVPLGDEREPLWVDREALAAMVAHFEARGLDLVVDYEHQTLSGQKAPAAGWIKNRSSQQLAVSSQWGRAFLEAERQIPPDPPL
jgi:phage I-like protein